MYLYYADGEREVGPIGKDELQALIKAKRIDARTLVRQEGMTDWEEFGIFARRKGWIRRRPARPDMPERQSFCSECGGTFPEADMIRFRDSHICATCKPAFIQKIKEGVPLAGTMDYAGFWIRFAALFIDGIIQGIINVIIVAPLGMLMAASAGQPEAMISIAPLITLFQYALPAAYDSWFVGKYGATPGKMACKLKVVEADGGQVSYLKALGRHFAKYISWLILFIGFIMAAFDDEKRTLHDRICDTRVIRT